MNSLTPKEVHHHIVLSLYLRNPQLLFGACASGLRGDGSPTGRTEGPTILGFRAIGLPWPCLLLCGVMLGTMLTMIIIEIVDVALEIEFHRTSHR